MKRGIPDEKVSGKWVKYKRVEGLSCVTLAGMAWQCMNARCRPNSTYQAKTPTYIGCAMSDEFADFQTFAGWYTNQVGYGLGYDLDKDILLPGNKLYSSERCVLIPAALNSFLVGNGARRGEFKQGVHRVNKTGKFIAMVCSNSGRRYLGQFETEDEAFEAYLAAKTFEGLAWAARLEAGEFKVDPRVAVTLRQKDWRRDLTGK